MRNVVPPPNVATASCSPRLARPHSVANLWLLEHGRPERKWDRRRRPRRDALAAPLTDDGRKMVLSEDLPICGGVSFQLRGPCSMLALGEKKRSSFRTPANRCNPARGKRPSSSAAMRRLGTATEGCPGEFAANPRGLVGGAPKLDEWKKACLSAVGYRVRLASAAVF